MSGAIRGASPEPLALEVGLARYVASLPEGKSVALADLAEEFGCSRETLRRALEAVLDVEDRDMVTISGAAIEDGRLVKYLQGGYEREFRRPVRLSPVQGRATLLALDVVSGAVDPGMVAGLRNKVRGALSKVGDKVPEVEAGQRFDEDVSVVAAIDRARRERLVLEIRYPSSRGIVNRPVEPLQMSNIEGTWYLNAYCRYAEAPRLFRLERVLSARLTDGRFAPREMELKTKYEDIDPRSYAARRAVVRFSARIARWMEERLELDLLEEYEDGSADYALYYTDPGWAASRIMQYLGDATVLEPDELREEIHRRASALLERYENGESRGGE